LTSCLKNHELKQNYSVLIQKWALGIFTTNLGEVLQKDTVHNAKTQ